MSTAPLEIALLAGGPPSEHRVSLASAAGMAANLSALGHRIHPLLVAEDRSCALLEPGTPWPEQVETAPQKARLRGEAPAVLAALKAQGCALAVLALHGPFGEDGRIQALCEICELPYTGSGVAASALAMDKTRTKRLLRTHGIPTPPAEELPGRAGDERVRERLLALGRDLGFPLVIKPRALGSSVGVSIARSEDEAVRAFDAAAQDSPEGILVEAFVAGRELSVPVVQQRGGARALPVIEIRPMEASWFDYASKYEDGGAEEIVPAPLDDALTRRVQDLAVRAHLAVGAAGVSRSDFILGANDLPWFLEINTTPGMTPTSLVPRSARVDGAGIDGLFQELVRGALERAPGAWR